MLERIGFHAHSLHMEKDFRNLNQAAVLIIATGEPDATRAMPEKMAATVERFVRSGGGLLCAGDAWSWTDGGEPTHTFPLNVLGRTMGFSVLERTVRAPKNISPLLMGGLDEIHRSNWWASEVRVRVKGAEPLITDEDLHPMAVRFRYGLGRVVVVGHRDLLRENPDVFRNMLLHLSGLDEHLL